MRAICLVLSLLLLAPAVAAADAETAARDFLNALKNGDVERAKKSFDVRFVSLPRDGLDALFGYESGREPNLAFLVGQPFEAGSPVTVSTSRSEWYILDGTHGRSLAVRLRFEGPQAPFVLPPQVAFGRPMAFVDFMNYVRHPERERSEMPFTLRLRQRVTPGVIAPPPPRAVEILPPPVSGESSRRAVRSAPLSAGEGGLLGWQRPRDPGAVVLPSGEPLTPPQLEALLPRLHAITIRLTVMQRGRFAAWRVESFGFANALFFSHGVETSAR